MLTELGSLPIQVMSMTTIDFGLGPVKVDFGFVLGMLVIVGFGAWRVYKAIHKDDGGDDW